MTSLRSTVNEDDIQCSNVVTTPSGYAARALAVLHIKFIHADT